MWQDYDTNNILITDDWQRCLTIDDLYSKIEEVKESSNRLDKIKTDFVKRLPTEEQYYKEFEIILNDCIKR